MGKVLNINKEEFEEKVLKNNKLTLVDFWASWCVPCQMMAPILDKLSDEIGDSVDIMKVNTEEPGNQELSIKYKIMSIPNMKLFKDGEIIQDFVGMRDKETFKKELGQFIK